MTGVSAIPSISQNHSLSPTFYLAGDLGKSACKFLYWQELGEFHPLWLGSEVVEGVSEGTLKSFDAAGDLTQAAWLRVGERNILVGNAAAGYGSSFAANKVDIAAYQVATALALAAMKANVLDFHAVLSLAIPLNEFRYRAQVEDRLKDIGAGFICCDRAQQFTFNASFYPEGTGLYWLHKKEQELMTAAPYTRRVVVLMLGHRNLSVLVFEGGKLNASLSQTSDTLGFWNCFKTDAMAAGIREADYNSLLAAVTSGNPQQLSKVEGGLKDFSAGVEMIYRGEMQRLEVFCRDSIIELLIGSTHTDVLIGGGAAHVLRSHLRDYFSSLGLSDRLYFADGVGGRLLTLAEQTYNAGADLARPIRLADVYGLAQALAGKVHRGR